MKRVAIYKDYWGKPNKSDFEIYDAQIIVDRLLAYYTLNNKGELRMVHPFQINDIAVRNNVNTHFREIMCQEIEQLPESCWQQVIEELDLIPQKKS
ncbi:MAG: hypothetical protein ACK5Z5_06595 [Neisseriaceae bacterium]|jgi:hypothetical protein